MRRNRRREMREAAARARGEGEEPPAPAAAAAPAAPAARADAPLSNTLGSHQALPGEIECPRCAERIKARAKECRHCGAEVSVAGAKRSRSERLARGGGSVVHHHHHHGGSKSGGVAAVLAFFLPGLGHVYAGQIAAGLVYMLVVWPLAVAALLGIGGGGLLVALRARSFAAATGVACVVMVAWLALWVWQIYDAYSAAERGNSLRR